MATAGTRHWVLNGANQCLLADQPQVHQIAAEVPPPTLLFAERALQSRLIQKARFDQQFAEPLSCHLSTACPCLRDHRCPIALVMGMRPEGLEPPRRWGTRS